MGSRRLPGKVLRPVAGKPMLQYLLERLVRCRQVNEHVVATSHSDQDTPIVELCEQLGAPCQRGPLEDVAKRFRQVVDEHRFDVFVRVNGDSPLLDPGLIDRAVERFCREDADIVTNVLERTYPRGQSVEVVRGDVFRRAQADEWEAEDREHVTRYFYRNRGRFRIVNLRLEPSHGHVHLAVDAPEDMTRFGAIVGQMRKPHWEYGLEEVLQFYKRVADP